MMVEKWNLSRDEMEAFAVESHVRAIKARAEGRFEAEISPLNGVQHDEGPREPNWEKDSFTANIDTWRTFDGGLCKSDL